MEYAYAALILSEADAELNEHNLTDVLEAAGVAVEESRVKALVAALEGVDLAAIRAEAAADPPELAIGSEGDAEGGGSDGLENEETAGDDEDGDPEEGETNGESLEGDEGDESDEDVTDDGEPAAEDDPVLEHGEEVEDLVPVESEDAELAPDDSTSRPDAEDVEDTEEVTATASGETHADGTDRRSPGGS